MRKWLLVIAILVALVLAACGGGESEEGDADPAVDSEDERTLTIAIGSDMISFDIHNHTNTSTEAIHVNMFDYLVKRNNETGDMESGLAETFELVDDTTWEFKLFEGVKFHNGDELTSEDVKFSLERVAHDSELLEHTNYMQIEEVEVIDDYKFRIHTENPEPALLNRISRIGSGILPSDYIEENGMDHFLKEPMGTGPFKFVEWDRDSKIVFDVYDDYFDGKNEEWDEIVFRIIPENSTRVSELLTGGVDIAVNMPPSDWDRIKDTDGVTLVQEDSNRTIMIFVRGTEGYPTEDRKVREALDLAINNEAIVESLLDGSGTPTITRVAPGNFGFNEELYDTYNYDVERAKELLDEAGYPDGFEMTLHSPRGRYLQDAEISEMVAGMLSEIGVTVNVEYMEWSNFAEMRAAGENEDAFLLGLGNSMFDAANALDWYDYDRFEGTLDYYNEEVEDLLFEASQNMDLEERDAQYQEAQELLAEDVGALVLHQESINIGVNERVHFVPTMDEMIYVQSITRE